MVDQHEIDRPHGSTNPDDHYDLSRARSDLDIEHLNDAVIAQLIEDCKEILHRRTVAKLYRLFGEGAKNGQHTR